MVLALFKSLSHKLILDNHTEVPANLQTVSNNQRIVIFFLSVSTHAAMQLLHLQFVVNS